jgi:hypothetical protein
LRTEHEVIVFVCAEGDAISSYADLHRVDADPDPTFHFDADTDRFTHVGKSKKFSLLFSAVPSTLFELFSQRNIYQYF